MSQTFASVSCKISVYFRLPESQSESKSDCRIQGCMLSGLLHDSTNQLQGPRRIRWALHFVFRHSHQTFLNRVESRERAFQDDQEILLSYRTISRMNELPPAPYRLLDLSLVLFAHDQAVN